MLRRPEARQGSPANCSTRSKTSTRFLWACGGCFSDFLIHNIDECCWMKDAWPIRRQGLRRPHYRGNFIDQNFDTLLRRVHLRRRRQAVPRRAAPCPAATRSSPATPTARRARRSSRLRATVPAKCRIFKTQNITMRSTADVVWQGPKEEPDPYQLEWDDYMTAIRSGQALQRGRARRDGHP